MKQALARLVGRIMLAWPANRVVAASSLVTVPLAGWLATWAAKQMPMMPHFTSGQLSSIMKLGMAGAIAAVYKFLHGWQRHEEQQSRAAEGANAPRGPPSGEP